VQFFLKSHNVSKHCLHFPVSNFELWSVKGDQTFNKEVLFEGNACSQGISAIFRQACVVLLSFVKHLLNIFHGLVQTLNVIP